MRGVYQGAFLVLWICYISILVSSAVAWTTTSKTFQYFAIGSNVQPTTMTSLRNLHPLNASAAVLPGYRLAFNVRGTPFLEPSAAAAVKCSNNDDDSIHGVVYEMSAQEFRQLSRSEGVPFAYRWEKCQVYPYKGDSDAAGAKAMSSPHTAPIDAYVLVAQPLSASPIDIPPSPSYLRIIQNGAAYWKLDASYQQFLTSVPTSKTLLVPDGLSGRLLETAEFFNPRNLPKRY